MHTAVHGFAHSETPGSKDVCSSPGIIAACRVLHRLPVPRHPPCARGILRDRIGPAGYPRVANKKLIDIMNSARMSQFGYLIPRHSVFHCARDQMLLTHI